MGDALFVLYRPGHDVWAFGVEPARVRFRLRLARYPALAESLTAWLDACNTPRPRLLDIGAGFGRTFLYLDAAGIADRFELLGLDIDPDRKRDVYTNNGWNIVQGDAERPLAFADQSFDVVVCEQLLEHLNRPAATLREIRRILKPDGLFVVGVPIFPEPLAKLRRWWVSSHGLRGSKHVQTYSLDSIRGDLAPHFEVIETRGFRIVSGGVLRPLENYAWWYKLNRCLGRWFPGWCVEVQLLVRPGTSTSSAAAADI
jgi:SAM-dependent methyltransferase